ncbi:hypothetical protein V8F20_000314 [Naviculisporaceae sp. PSN 640]
MQDQTMGIKPGPNEQNGRQRLIQTILDLAAKAFSPEAARDTVAQRQAQRDFDDFVQRTKTWNLTAALNILVRPGHCPEWLHGKLKETLARIPLRPDGVRTSLEFVFAVHPSSTVRSSEAAAAQKKGANITLEALQMATRIVAAPPQSVPPDTWYASVAPQLLQLLDGGEGPELAKAVAYIIGFGILGTRTLGAPGTPGWKYLAWPILEAIKPPARENDAPSGEEIIDLSKDKVLVSHADLARALRRMRYLTASHPNPGLCKRLLRPLLLPLWALSSWPNPKQELNEHICAPALELLQIFLKLAGSSEILLDLVHNVGYIGGQNPKSPEWVYKETDKGELQIVDATHRIGNNGGNSHQISLQDMDYKIPKLMELVTSSFSDADISTVFLTLLEKWLNSSKRSKVGNIIIKEETEDTTDPMAQLTEVRILQALMQRFPDKLATQPRHILSLVSQILAGQDDLGDEEEVLAVALSLLNMIITAPGFQKSKADPETIGSIEASLETLSKNTNISDTGLTQTATNLHLLLKYRDELHDPTETPTTTTTAPTNRQIEDRKTYSLAISYIRQSDSPPPVRSEGLNLIQTLITAQSPILDIPGILVLMSSLIRDPEDYIYLRVIKIYTLLASKHPKSVTKELLDHYIDAKETESVDSRLRFGEALLQVVERLGETFTGEVAREVGDALLSIASRRGRRPKTEAKQKKDERLREMKKNRKNNLDDIMDDDDEEEELTPEEKARQEILAKIVTGWESRRGTEDVRIRASAISILSSAIESNISGSGPTLLSTAVDLCINILQLETEMEKGILRRAAVLLVLSFVRALDKAREEGRQLGIGFGINAREDVKRTLGYIAQTDDDGLVRQHAEDVIESLGNWEVRRLVGDSAEVGSRSGFGIGAGGGLTKLAGLVVDPERSASFATAASAAGGDGSGAGAGARFGSRPRIEEIE